MPLDPETKERLRSQISDFCVEIEQMFKPGAVVTVIVRNPQYGDGTSADVVRA